MIQTRIHDMNKSCDLFVIGAGSGGVRAARIAAELGATVVVAESSAAGGTCVNLGCIPKKLLVYASELHELFELSGGYGFGESNASFKWKRWLENKNKEIKRLNGIYETILQNNKVELIRAPATLTSTSTVECAGQTWTCKNILIATGSRPFKPAFEGVEHTITSNEAFHLEKNPEKAVVVGGGYIAVEFAGIFNNLGCETHLVYRGSQILKHFDHESGAFLQEEMRKKGIHLHLNSQPTKVSKEKPSLVIELNSGEKIKTELVLMATGRTPNSHRLGLDNAGVKTSKNGAILVNENYETNIHGIHAIGDVIDKVQLTPVALEEGTFLARKLFGSGDSSSAVDYSQIPTAIFSQPNMGTVGLSEEDALQKHNNLSIFTTSFKPLFHTLSGSEERSFLKLIVENDQDRVVGAHMVGAHAGEIIQGLGVALKTGASKKDFDSTIAIHPTTAEEFVTMRKATRVYRNGQQIENN